MAYLRVPVVGVGTLTDAIRPAIDGLVPYSAVMPLGVRAGAQCLVWIADSDVMRLPALLRTIVPDEIARPEALSRGCNPAIMERLR